ncbi:MAG: aldehyde dehydrogenase family protein [Acidimicrobiales bacterium]|nr:aldehyde dehydrogenase family protein [Acidimicrobiales bacterium]
MHKADSWIDGEWRASKSGSYAESVNPAAGRPLEYFADANRDDAKVAISTARRSFEASTWAQSPRLRAKTILDFADRLDARAPEIRELLTLEHGKPILQSRMEVALSAAELRFYAGLARNVFGRVMEIEPDNYSMLTSEPMGVAGIIVPWNAPIILLIRSLAPAMAAGCTSVVKAAPQTALANAAVFAALSEVDDLPAGVVNMFAETGNEGAKELVSSTDVDVISYTGSTEVGKQIMRAGADNMKRMNLELGGSAPCLIFPDADLEKAVPSLIFAGLFISGQQCVAASRLVVHESILEEFTERFASALKNVVVGPGIEPATQMGPMIDAPSRDRILGLIADASSDVDWIVKGGAPGGKLSDGYFVTPSLARIENKDEALANCEIFGPILTIQSFADDDEALAIANRTSYGLAASVWTGDLCRGQHLARRIESGTVWLNKHGQLHAEIETGGYKESGLGRLHGVEGLYEFLQTKHISWETNS